jgi:hypothetical protein
MYLLSLLRERGKFLSKNELIHPPKDHFLKAFEFLSSRGGKYRETKTVNNRVDAYNYSLVNELNAGSGPIQYVYVSASSAMENLDRSNLPRPQDAIGWVHNVWGIRRAVLFQLFRLAARNSTEAEQIAWRLVGKISEYTADIARLLSSKQSMPDVAIPNFGSRSDEIFLKTVSGIGELQSQLNDVKFHHQRRLKWLKHTYDRRDPTRFFNLLKRELKCLFKRAGYSFELQRNFANHNYELSVIPRPKDGLDLGYDWHHRVVAVAKLRGAKRTRLKKPRPVFDAFGYKSGYTIYSVESKVSIVEFIETFNYINRFEDQDVGPSFINYEKSKKITVGVRGSGYSIFDFGEFSFPLSLKQILETAGCAVNDIFFIRFDNTLFSCSYEDGEYLIGARHNIKTEAGVFLRELGMVEFRGSDILGVVEKISNAALEFKGGH